MLVMTFVKDRDEITPLELEMIRFVNGNIDEMIHMAMDITDIDEDAMDWFFPYGYYKRNKEKCADILHSLRQRIHSSVLYDDLKPIYNYVLYHIIDWYVVINEDFGCEELRFPLPQGLKERIINDPDWRDEVEDKEETVDKDRDPFIITILESAKEYTENCFEDTDFLEEDLRGAVQAAIHNPIMFKTFSTYEELDQCIELMPLDVAEEYVEYRKNHSEYTIESILLTELVNISSVLCTNANYDAQCSENAINDYYRDMLRAKGYFAIADQTRYGLSATGNEAGEVDLVLRRDDRDIAIIEGLKLSYVDGTCLKRHINKTIINYNALGLPVYILIYATANNYIEFWERLFAYLEQYDYPLAVYKKMEKIEVPFATVKTAGIDLMRDGRCVPVTFIVVKIRKEVAEG